ncbi:hypothetical protein M758_6G070800 [Ceratodon purpureus]|nr:hypothetical protein M758_6G070800 [Ceratodon purpureus]
MQNRLEQNSHVARYLVRMSAKCGRLKDARQVFDNLSKSDILSWTSMIRIFSEHGDIEEAFKLFHRMVGELESDVHMGSALVHITRSSAIL